MWPAWPASAGAARRSCRRPNWSGRLTIIQSAAQRYLRQIPDARLGDMLPNRPRSYGQLVYHTFNIADAFLEHEMQGLPLREGAYSRVQAPGSSKGQIAAYGQDVLERLGGWWDEAGNSTDYEARPRSTTATSRCTITWSAPPGTRASTCAS